MPSDFRFDVGTSVLCNLGPSGWKLGRVIALHYREDHWPEGQEVPYQVALENEDGDVHLIFAPEDDDRVCKKATAEDLKIAHRTDALAELPSEIKSETSSATSNSSTTTAGNNKNAIGTSTSTTSTSTSSSTNTNNGGNNKSKSELGSSSVAVGDHCGYRAGLCHQCNPHPESWSCVDLYSEHYLMTLILILSS